jgi:hypothetical protein
LVTNAKRTFLQFPKNAETINSIINFYGPVKLLELTELIKSKIFGCGLGSYQQKLIRSVMESWRIDFMSVYLSHNFIEFYSLLRIIHPRYQGERGSLVKSHLEKQKLVIH